MISGLINSILKYKKEIKTRNLPSQGFFYKDDFKIYIEKASMDSIVEYQYSYKRDNIGNIISNIKNVVKKHTSFSKGYSFEHIKSIDIIYIFLEIVKFTNKKDILIPYVENLSGKEGNVKFSHETFNYFTFDVSLMKYYDADEAEFKIKGYRFSIPCIGVEDSLTKFLSKKTDIVYNQYNYDFMYFLSGKSSLSDDEIDNLIQIFSFDIDDSERELIMNIIEKFKGMMNYSLRKGSDVIDINSTLDLENVWNY